MVSRPKVFVMDVTTTRLCRDLFSVQLMSRPLNDVATFSLFLMMSRLLNDVATLISLQANVATASVSELMSRPLPDVATSMFSQL